MLHSKNIYLQTMQSNTIIPDWSKNILYLSHHNLLGLLETEQLYGIAKQGNERIGGINILELAQQMNGGHDSPVQVANYQGLLVVPKLSRDWHR